MTSIADVAMPAKGSTKYNPYTEAVEDNAHRDNPDAAKKAGPFSMEGRPSEVERQRSLIYQAGRLAGYRIKTVLSEHGDGTATIFFQVKHDEHNQPMSTEGSSNATHTETPKRSRARD